jgi:hypothetical protein
MILGALNADHAGDGRHPKPFIPGTLFTTNIPLTGSLNRPEAGEHRAFKSSSADPSIFEHWNDSPRLNLWTE